MPVFQPNAILGNSRSLVTLGGAGEIMTFFYPHIDFPQNIQEGMPAVYLGSPGQGHLTWTFDDVWQKRQSYVPRRNILVTELHHVTAGLTLTITDFIHPRRDVFVRRFTLKNNSGHDQKGVLMQYLALRLGEMARRNSARRLDNEHAIVQYWRHICFAMGGDPFDATQIGKAGGLSGNSAKNDMQDGYLSNQREELGDVDTAYAWNFWLRPGEEFHRLFLISAATNEASALSQLSRAYQQGFDELYELTDRWWSAWLSSAAPVELDQQLTETYYRSLLATRLLYDERYGSFLAAPEFDPLFERCGGYGFVWPRDAAEVVLALEEAGLPNMVERFFEWARSTQRPEGYWEQRYWISGERGPGWCSFLDSIQIDQTGSIVYALGTHADRLPSHERHSYYERYWPVVENATNYLVDALGEDGLHTQAFDLWEKFRGSFTYSNASIYAALRAAAIWAEARGQEDRGGAWLQAAERIKSVILSQCWNGNYFARGVNTEGQLDWQVDSSMLGMFDPFGVLSLDVPEERAMVESMVRVIRERLTKHLPDGEAIIRHEGDDYVDGSAGGVNTLWLARVMLMLANYYRGRDEAKSQQYRTQAEQYMRVVIARGTGTGLLPELIGGGATSRWAAPHGWAMASFVQCALLLNKLN
ncbi:MAG TPA: glycoside hydrolase family 15 protein [Armatimonadota bacterium]|nr:glycoside hydrolase family 15 protein [Armatimonadota bacterium]